MPLPIQITTSTDNLSFKIRWFGSSHSAIAAVWITSVKVREVFRVEPILYALFNHYKFLHDEYFYFNSIFESVTSFLYKSILVHYNSLLFLRRRLTCESVTFEFMNRLFYGNLNNSATQMRMSDFRLFFFLSHSCFSSNMLST